jgi:hypothetical protein
MANVVSAQVNPQGKVTITYDDGTTSVVTQAEAKKQGITVSSAPNAIKSGSYNSGDPFGATVVDPTTGQSVSGDLTVPTKQGVRKLTDLVMEARNATNLGKIRTALIANGLLSKGTRSTTTVQNAWTQVLIGASTQGVDPFDYMSQLKASGFGQDIAQQADLTPQQSIWAPDKAQSFITEQYRSTLHRDPTAEELAKDTKALLKEQQKFSSASKQEYVTVTEIVNGKPVKKKVLRSTTGLDENQWFANKLNKSEEYKTLQSQIATAANQQLEAIAAANGIQLSPLQMSEFGKRIAAGENPEVIKAVIRGQAALGQPENVKKLLSQGLDLAEVYSPYKTAMAKVLELNPDAITLDDPTLRSAFTPTGEQTLYDFQRTLRKDPRWQYTDNARTEVADSVTKVLQDFGFKG